MPLCAISFMLMGLLHVHTSMTVSGGFIDFIVFGIIPFVGGKGTNFYWILVVGVPYIAIYFAAFYFCIKYGKVGIPGRDGSAKLYTKADFKAKQGGSEANVVPVKGVLPNVKKPVKLLNF